MIKALLLIFEPVEAWDRVVRAQRSLVFVLVTYLAPMLLLVAAVEGAGLVAWGKWRADGLYLKKFATSEVVVFEAAQLLIMLGIVFLGAKIIKSLGETFHGRHTFTQAFVTVAYGLSPLFLLRLPDAFPAVSPWVTWVIGIVLCAGVLYHGVPRVMQPDPPQAFGLYFMSALLVTLITGLERFVTAWYLTGHFSSVESAVKDLGARLPF